MPILTPPKTLFDAIGNTYPSGKIIEIRPSESTAMPDPILTPPRTDVVAGCNTYSAMLVYVHNPSDPFIKIELTGALSRLVFTSNNLDNLVLVIYVLKTLITVDQVINVFAK